MNNPDHISESLESIFWVKILFDVGRGSGLEKFGSVGDSNIIHVSKSRPFWNNCFILPYGMVTLRTGKDDLGRYYQ